MGNFQKMSTKNLKKSVTLWGHVLALVIYRQETTSNQLWAIKKLLTKVKP